MKEKERTEELKPAHNLERILEALDLLCVLLDEDGREDVRPEVLALAERDFKVDTAGTG